MLTTDIATSFTGGGFGLGVQVQEQIHTLSEDGSSAADKLIGELNARDNDRLWVPLELFARCVFG